MTPYWDQSVDRTIAVRWAPAECPQMYTPLSEESRHTDIWKIQEQICLREKILVVYYMGKNKPGWNTWYEETAWWQTQHSCVPDIPSGPCCLKKGIVKSQANGQGFEAYSRVWLATYVIISVSFIRFGTLWMRLMWFDLTRSFNVVNSLKCIQSNLAKAVMPLLVLFLHTVNSMGFSLYPCFISEQHVALVCVY